jgi:hypothetical protein
MAENGSKMTLKWLKTAWEWLKMGSNGRKWLYTSQK